MSAGRLLRSAALPVAVALLAHGLGLAGGFVLDDVPDLVQHPVVNGEAPLGDVARYDYMGSELGEGANTWRPLATLHFALEWRVFGERPALFHLVSLIWVAALAWGAQRLFLRFVPAGTAAVGAAGFAALAIHVDAVASIANRAEVQSLLFAIGAFLAAIRGRIGIAVGAYLLALGFKESAFLLPLIVAWHGLVYHGLEGIDPRRGGRTAWALGAAAIAFVALRSLVVPFGIGNILPADNPLLIAGAAERVWMPFVLLGKYLALTVAPLDLSFDYTYAAIPVALDPGEPLGWIGVGFVAGVVALAIKALRARSGPLDEPARLFLFAAGAFFCSYALFSNSVFLIVTLFAERLFLAPSLWLVLLALAGAEAVRRLAPQANRSLAALAAVVLLLQIPLAAKRTWEWRSGLSLTRAQVESQPHNVKGRLYLARNLARIGEREEALWHLGIAVAGREAFPGAFRAPVELEEEPIEERLRALPDIVSPGKPPSEFWPRFRAMAARMLGPETTVPLDRR